MSATRDLSSIYSLKFYRNKQDWKLSNSNQTKKPVAIFLEKSVKKKATKGHTVDVKDEVEEAAEPHNVAYMESQSYDSTLPSNQKSKLSIQWQHPINIPPSSAVEDPHKRPTKSVHDRLATLLKAAELYMDNNDGNCNTEMEPRCGTEAEDFDNGEAEEYCYSQELEFDAGEGASYIMDMDIEQVEFDEMMNMKDTWDVSSVGSEEFLKGADAAPHSSEAEYPITSCTSNLNSEHMKSLPHHESDSAQYTHMLQHLLVDRDLRHVNMDRGIDRGILQCQKTVSLSQSSYITVHNQRKVSVLQKTHLQISEWNCCDIYY